MMEFLKRRYVVLGTILFDLFLLWTVVHFVFGGWERTVRVYSTVPTLWGWIILVIVALNLIKSDFRTDIPMYLSAFGLAYWLEWWGTTRGVWTYSGNQTPPLGEIFLWGICLLSVFHASLLLLGKGERKRGKYSTRVMVLVLFVLPVVGFVLTWKFIISVDWMKYFDLHSVVAVLFAVCPDPQGIRSERDLPGLCRRDLPRRAPGDHGNGVGSLRIPVRDRRSPDGGAHMGGDVRGDGQVRLPDQKARLQSDLATIPLTVILAKAGIQEGRGEWERPRPRTLRHV